MRAKALYNSPFLSADFDIIQKAPEEGFYLAQDKKGLWQLHQVGQRPKTIDFASAYYRARGGKEYLPRAFKGLHAPLILDATAGWGRDAWLLAYRGFQMSLCEKNPYLYVLLQQGISLAKNNSAIFKTAQNLQALYGNALEIIINQGKDFGAIYLDPMFPPRQKSAKVKQEMQFLQALLPKNDDENNKILLEKALESACPRVVVKRPLHAPDLAEIKPHHRIMAPNTRYDVYMYH